MDIAGIYGRSSLGNGRQGETIEHQIQMIQEFAKRTNIKVKFHERFIYEDEESGYKTTLLQRKSMKKLLKDIDSGLIQVVFFKGISRFARDSGESIVTAKKLIYKGVRVISLEENYDSIRDDPTMFQLYAVMAEQESRKTSIRVSLGNKQKARNGLWTNSTTPIGTSKVKDLSNELKKKALSENRHPQSLYPNEKAFIIKQMFEMYCYEDMGRKRIVNWTVKKGYKTENGNNFSDKIVKDILTNPAYVGDIVYGKTRYEYIEDEIEKKKIQKTIEIEEGDWAVKRDAHPSIVGRDLFVKTQIKIKMNEETYNKKGRFNAAKHPLTGILKCNKCGSPMICQKRSNKRKDGTKKEYRYYVCSTYHQKGRGICSQANVNAEKIEGFVFEFLLKHIKELTDNSIKEHNQLENRSKEFDNELKSVNSRINKKVKASAVLLENIDIYDDETFRELNAKFKKEIEELRGMKAKLESKKSVLSFEMNEKDLDKLLKQFLKMDKSNIKQKRRLFHKCIGAIYVDDKSIENIVTKF